MGQPMGAHGATHGHRALAALGACPARHCLGVMPLLLVYSRATCSREETVIMSVTWGSHGETPHCIGHPSHLCLAWGSLAYWAQKLFKLGGVKYCVTSEFNNKALYYSVPRPKKYSILDFTLFLLLQPKNARTKSKNTIYLLCALNMSERNKVSRNKR